MSKGRADRTIRVPEALYLRAEALIPALEDSAAHGWLGRQSVASVLRLAAQQGIDALEAQLEAERRQRQAKRRGKERGATPRNHVLKELERRAEEDPK